MLIARYTAAPTTKSATVYCAPKNWVLRWITRSSSTYPMMNPSEESLSSTTSWAMRLGVIVRTACGSSTSTRVCHRVMPIASEASA